MGPAHRRCGGTGQLRCGVNPEGIDLGITERAPCPGCTDCRGLDPELDPTQRTPAGSPSAPPDLVPEVVALLEDLVEKARAGHITAVGIVAQTADGCAATSYEPGVAGLGTLVYATQVLSKRLLEHGEE